MSDPGELTADRARWLERRRTSGIAATEVAAMFGVDPRCSPLELYHRKRGEVPEPDLSGAERVVIGQHLEAGIAMAAAALFELRLRKAGFHTDPSGQPLCCTMDYQIEDPEHGWIPFEIKNIDFLVWRDAWDHVADGTHEPPLPIDLQVQAQMLVTGAPAAVICVLVGGSKLTLVPRKAHGPMQAAIRVRAASFWRRILEARPPEVDLARDLEVLSLTYLRSDGPEMDARGHAEATAIMEMHIAGMRKIAEGEDLKARAKTKMLLFASDAPSVLTDQGRVSLKTVAGQPARRVEQTFQATQDHREIRFYPKKLSRETRA